MFEQPPPNLPIEDIFEKVDAAPKAGPGAGPPTSPIAPRPAAIRPVAPGTPPALIESPGGGARKVVLFVVLSLVVVGGFAGAVYAFRGLIFRQRAQPPAAVTPAPPPAPTETPVNANLPPPVTEAPANVPPPTPVQPALTDTDGDGLDDAQELAIGTNPNATDTDADGLSDFDEVRIWQTDPLNPDSDADGYSDGTEVKNGYNPKGAGKLTVSP